MTSEDSRSIYEIFKDWDKLINDPEIGLSRNRVWSKLQSRSTQIVQTLERTKQQLEHNRISKLINQQN